MEKFEEVCVQFEVPEHILRTVYIYIYIRNAAITSSFRARLAEIRSRKYTWREKGWREENDGPRGKRLSIFLDIL